MYATGRATRHRVQPRLDSRTVGGKAQHASVAAGADVRVAAGQAHADIDANANANANANKVIGLFVKANCALLWWS